MKNLLVKLHALATYFRSKVSDLNAVNDTLHILRGGMLRLASQQPEFDIAMAMQSAGEVTDPQLMAETGVLAMPFPQATYTVRLPPHPFRCRLDWPGVGRPFRPRYQCGRVNFR